MTSALASSDCLSVRCRIQFSWQL